MTYVDQSPLDLFLADQRIAVYLFCLMIHFFLERYQRFACDKRLEEFADHPMIRTTKEEYMAMPRTDGEFEPRY